MIGGTITPPPLALIFRWFKFTLKPPDTMACGNFLLSIWNTSHWIFLSNLDSRHLENVLWQLVATFERCQFVATPGLFDYFSKNRPLQKSKISQNNACRPNIGIYPKVGRYIGYMIGSFFWSATHFKGGMSQAVQKVLFFDTFMMV